MQIIHLGLLGLWKTGTINLRRLVFRHANVPFIGEGSPNSNKSESDAILRLVRGDKVSELEHLRSNPCILSHGAGLLLCGGLAGLGKLLKSISGGFENPLLY
jgi:hypothetical protein